MHKMHKTQDLHLQSTKTIKRLENSFGEGNADSALAFQISHMVSNPRAHYMTFVHQCLDQIHKMGPAASKGIINS